MKPKRRKWKFNLPNFIIGTVILLFTIACVLPLLLTVIISFTDETAIMRDGYRFFPAQWSVEAYRLIFTTGSSVVRGYMISTFVTVVGSITAVLITAMAAYTLSNKNVVYRGALGLFFFIPLVFAPGIVPWFLINTALGLRDNILALIIPSLLFNAFNLFLVRNYMSSLPDSLRESAKIDGANDAIIAFRIYFPLCVPVLATILLFYGLGYWNDWWNAIMLVDNPDLYPIQFLLLQLRSRITMIRELQFLGGAVQATPPAESLTMATAVITIGPIVALYPFLQRYYVKGLVVGSVKG